MFVVLYFLFEDFEFKNISCLTLAVIQARLFLMARFRARKFKRLRRTVSLIKFSKVILKSLFLLIVVIALAVAIFLQDIPFAILIAGFIYLILQSFDWLKKPRYPIDQRKRKAIYIGYALWTLVSLFLPDAPTLFISDLYQDNKEILAKSEQVFKSESLCFKKPKLVDCYTEHMIPFATSHSTNPSMSAMLLLGGLVKASSIEGKAKKLSAKNETEIKILGLRSSLQLWMGINKIHKEVYKKTLAGGLKHYFNLIQLFGDVGLRVVLDKIDTRYENSMAEHLYKYRNKLEKKIMESRVPAFVKDELKAELSNPMNQ